MTRHARPHRLRPIPAALSSATRAATLCSGLFLGAAAQAQETPQVTEIVITAQKRTERLKDTPVAASVVADDALAKANATDISDINRLVPSVQLKGSFNGRVPLAMRGISTNANEAAIGLTSGVSIMIDGVPVPSDSMAANELQDIRRVEVLKGPQSTLGGRTASSGVINLVTGVPSKTWNGEVGGTVTNDKEYRVNARVSGPLSSALGLSVAAYSNQRDYPIKNLMLGEKSHTEASGARMKLGLAVDKTLDITLMARTAESDSTGGTFTYQYLTPGAALFPNFPFAPAGISQAAAFPGISIRYGNTDYASPVRMRNQVRDNDVSLTVEKRFGDYTFSSITAQQKEKISAVQDVTAQATLFLDVLRQGFIPDPPIGPPLFDNTQTIKIKPKSTSQEFKIASPIDQDVSFVAGLFYSDVDVTQDHFRMMFVNPKIDYVTSSTQTLGLYGRATWKLGADTSLLTGLRHNRDKVAYSIEDRSTQFSSANADSSRTTVGDLTLRRKLGKDHMVYGTYARGYKPRAFNTAATLSSNAALQPVDQEDIDHLELGAKSSLMGGALALNLAAFNTTYKNFQVQLYPPGQIIPSLELANAAKARTRGLELDASWAASSATKLSFGAAYIDAKFLSFKAGPAYPGQTEAQGAVLTGFDSHGAPVFAQDLSGKPMPDAPKFKLTLAADHEVAPAGWPLRLNFNAQYAYRTSALLQGNQNPATRQPGFGILNLGVTATPESGKYQVSAFVNNALNKFYLVNAEDFFSGLYSIPGNPPGAANAVIGQPARDAKRYVGLRFSVFFD
ncbi:TonB-dependent receptor [Aquabacterium sp.]|uniref:TonB-dependent receptor n=1 Tax=Aquabacterium sp. TaxID=1872578 RepID=UPI002C97E2C8|nr:TonB-dependent receptor [Aquabacterium sp.]HSW04359.1 TonB-dependent receptor [Aquabacterium sp.]